MITYKPGFGPIDDTISPGQPGGPPPTVASATTAPGVVPDPNTPIPGVTDPGVQLDSNGNVI